MKFKVFFAMLILLLCTPASMAQTFNNVICDGGGYPAIGNKKVGGNLAVREDRMVFNASDGRTFTLPFDNLTAYHYEYGGGSRGVGFSPLLAIAGPNPALLASTLGFSALQLMVAQLGHKSPNYRFTVQYEDYETRQNYDITFLLSNKNVLAKLESDFKSQVNQYTMSGPSQHEPSHETVKNLDSPEAVMTPVSEQLPDSGKPLKPSGNQATTLRQ